MNRNTEAHFAKLPNLNIARSVFDRSHQVKTSFNVGKLIPILVDEYIPGDTFSTDTAIVARTSTMIKPVMDNMYLDIFYFSVPNRLVWTHWAEFNGENTSGPWTQQTEYTIPQTTSPTTTGWTQGTIADYMGIPTKVPGLSVSSLFFRAYCLIWNEYFRDENLQNPTAITRGDSTTTGTNGTTLETSPQTGGDCLPVNKYHDYFTSCLPNPQKGPDVSLPLGTKAPVHSTTEILTTNTHSNPVVINSTVSGQLRALNYGMDAQNNMTLAVKSDSASESGSQAAYFNNLWTDLTRATAATINQLRQAFATQRLYEKDARGGTRYIEIIKSHFGVTSADARLQRPEYLGGKRIPLNVSQVVQTSSTDSTSAQANVSAYSLTNDVDSSYTKSFTEHGMIIGLACVRTEHTYQQGLNRMFSRKRRFDFYWPSLSNIGEQSVYNKEIYAQGSSVVDSANKIIDEQTFGYQEAWAEYRYKPSIVTGQMRSNATGTLDIYHYADKYTALPTLGQTWIQETKSNVDRTLAVTSTTANQIQADIYIKITSARPMPTYSVPGLIDHN